MILRIIVFILIYSSSKSWLLLMKLRKTSFVFLRILTLRVWRILSLYFLFLFSFIINLIVMLIFFLIISFKWFLLFGWTVNNLSLIIFQETIHHITFFWFLWLIKTWICLIKCIIMWNFEWKIFVFFINAILYWIIWRCFWIHLIFYIFRLIIDVFLT